METLGSLQLQSALFCEVFMQALSQTKKATSLAVIGPFLSSDEKQLDMEMYVMYISILTGRHHVICLRKNLHILRAFRGHKNREHSFDSARRKASVRYMLANCFEMPQQDS